MKKAVLMILLCGWLSPVWAGQWTIAVLALRGDTHALAQWQPLINHLNRQFPDESFQLLPLNLADMGKPSATARSIFCSPTRRSIFSWTIVTRYAGWYPYAPAKISRMPQTT